MCCYNAQIFFWCHVQFHQRPSVQYNIVIWIKDYVKLRGDGWKQMDKWSSGHTFSPTYTPWQKLSRSLRWKSQTKILKSHFCLSLTNSTSIHFFVFPPPLSFFFCLFRSPLPASSPWSGGRQRVSALTQRSLQELLWLAVLCSTVHNRLRHGELPLTAFLCCSCGFDTVTQTPTSPLTLQPLSSLFLFVSFTFSL